MIGQPSRQHSLKARALPQQLLEIEEGTHCDGNIAKYFTDDRGRLA